MKLSIIIAISVAALFSLGLFALLDWLGKKTERRLKKLFEQKHENDESKESKSNQKDG